MQKMKVFGSRLYNFSHKRFSHGPFNPMNYKNKLVGSKKLTTEEMYYVNKKAAELTDTPFYNMRHVHPIRQSGPIPPYYGTYTMEDVRKHAWTLRAPYEGVSESTDVEELMRRIPGLTRREALKIQSFGFSPYEELDFAYLVVNNGIDVFYETNNSYLLRQVVTNSKGEKVECLFPSNEGDEFTYLAYSEHTGYERMDHSYDPVPGDPPVAPMPDYELQAPYSWFEYEQDNRLHYIMCQDQQMIPEDERPCPVKKNPYCSKELWRPQSDLQEEKEMEDPNWYPKNTKYNIYNRSDYSRENPSNLDENNRL